MEFYVNRSTFWADLLATLPLFAQIGVAISGNETSALRFIYMLRLLRLVRWGPPACRGAASIVWHRGWEAWAAASHACA